MSRQATVHGTASGSPVSLEPAHLCDCFARKELGLTILKRPTLDLFFLSVPDAIAEALLLLEDGSIFVGRAIGARGVSVGEVVFNTGMVGYCESMTDPSYAGQLLCFTYPAIGNYGVPSYDKGEFNLPSYFESESIKVRGIIVEEACAAPSHWVSRSTLDAWLADEGVPGIEGVDTRALVIRLRESGVMMGILATGLGLAGVADLRERLRNSPRYSSDNLVEEVSVREPVVYGPEGKRIVLLDCGSKLGIVRNLLRRGYQVVRVPYNSSYASVSRFDPLGVVVSNGPGDPAVYPDTARTVESVVNSGLPVLGICFGEQILGMSQGAKTFKLKYGHRGQNKPCVDLTTGRGYVTSQNHGYTLDPTSLAKTTLKPWFINADDGTIEGVLDSERLCLAVQFHPEATPGPNDTNFVFDRFVGFVEGSGKRGEETRRMRA